MRSGDEPEHARSPLRMRLALAAFGLTSAVGSAILLGAWYAPAWAVPFGAIGIVALIDMLVVIRHLRQGAHWQPSRTTPPYRPSDDQKTSGRPDRAPDRSRT